MLSKLPPEVLLEILRGAHASFLVVMLWKCGDRLLNLKLTNSVTEVDLKDDCWISRSRYPKMLSSLVRLRHLRISRNDAYLMGSYADLATELARLPPTLVELRLNSLDSVDAVFCCSDSWCAVSMSTDRQIAGVNTSNISYLARSFPSMATLGVLGKIIPGACLLPQLPPQLLHLDVTCSDIQSYVGHLPRTLRTLKIGHRELRWTPELSSEIPPDIETLALQDVIMGEFEELGLHWCDSLPKNLKILTMRMPPSMPLSPLDIARLPRTLTEAHFNINWDAVEEAQHVLWPPGLAYLDDDVLYNSIEHSQLHLLPSSVHTINGVICPETRVDMSRLPPSITNLSYHLASGTLLRYLPPENEHAALLALDTYTASFAPNCFANLPSSLTRLTCPSFPTERVVQDVTSSLLNASLGATSSSASNSSAFPLALPPALTSLSLKCWRWEWFEHLPRTLSDLTLLCVELPQDPRGQTVDTSHSIAFLDANVFAHDWYWHLPPNLTTLKLQFRYSGVVGAMGVSTDGSLAEAARRASEILNPTAPRSFNSRTAVMDEYSLRLRNKRIFFGEMPFSRLPHLETLSIQTYFEIDSSMLRYLPLTIRSLSAHTMFIAPEDAPFLPPSLTSLNLGPTIEPMTLPMATLQYVPQRVLAKWLLEAPKSDKNSSLVEAARSRSVIYPDPRSRL